MSEPSTAAQLVAEPAQKIADSPAVDSAWSLLGSALSAFSGWASAHWYDIGLGAVAVILVLACTAGIKPLVYWVLKRRPVEDDTRHLILRGIVFFWAVVWAIALDFGEHFGAAIEIELAWYFAWPAGAALNSGLALSMYHAQKWLRLSQSPSARLVRQTGRVWWRRLWRVSKKETDAASTGMVVLADLTPDPPKDRDDGDK